MSAAPTASDASRPWLGLKSFGPTTQHLFYGRSREIRELFQRVKDQPLTVLYGKSGLGKTSLLGAGLVPRLLVEGYRPALIRLRFGANDPRLRDQVHAQLSAILAGDVTGTDSDDGAAAAAPTLWERMHHISARPVHLATAPPVLIFDQFEEVFTLADADQLSPGRREQVAELTEELADFVENRPPLAVRSRLLERRDLAEEYDFNASPLRIVIALREDYLASLEGMSDVMPSLMRNRQVLRELDGESALEAVVAPGRRNGAEIISDEVGKSIVCFVSRRPFDTPLDEIKAVPPILSLMCFELNEARLGASAASITAAQVEGESAEILHSFYERTFAALPPPVRNLVEDRLLTRSGHRNSIAREDALAELEVAGVADARTAVDRLIAGRILTSEEVGGIQRLELTHDVLAPLALRSRNERQERERAERAEREREESQARALEAQRERNRMRKIVAAMTVLVLIALGSTVLSWRKTREAQVAAARLMFLEADRGLGNAATFWSGVRDLGRSLGMGLPAVDSRVAYRLAQVIERRPGSIGSPPAAATLRDGPADATWAAGAPVTEPLAHKREVRAVAFSPDGKMLATASADGTARVWESVTGRPLTGPLTHGAQVTSVAFSPDGRRVVTASADDTARLWDAQSGLPVGAVMKHEEDVNHAVFSPDGQRVATASWDRTARVWNAETGEPVTPPLVHEASVNDVEFSPDGRLVVTASGDRTARIWDAQTGGAVGSPMVHEDAVVHAEMSADGRWVVTASADGTARVWDAKTAAAVSPPLRHEEAVNYAAFSPDGRWVVTASDDNTARVWEAATGKPVTRMSHDLDVLRATFDPSGTRVGTASADFTARLWSATTGELVAPKIVHDDAVVDVHFSPDGRWLATGSLDHTARVWETDRGATVAVPIAHAGDVPVAAFSRDGQQVVTGSWDGTARVWESVTGRSLTGPLTHGAQVTSVAFSPDGRRVVTASADDTARLWDAQSGLPVGAVMKHEEDVNHAVFSPDGQRVATASWDRTARVWNAETGEPVTPPLVHEASVNDVEFSPDGRLVVTASGDRTARIWDAQTGGAVGSPMVHEDAVVHAEMSADGRWVVTASADGTARVWDAKTAAAVSPPLRHEEAVNYAAFSPDGRWVVTASDDNTARVWEAATGKPVTASLAHADNVIHAGFSADGRWIATASWDRTARVWDAETGRPRMAPIEHDDFVLHVVFSADGRLLLTTSADDTASVVALSDYETVDPEKISEVLRRIVACTDDAATGVGDCHAARNYGTEIDGLTAKLGATEMRSWLRYHLLGDPAAHPLLAKTRYAGDPKLLRDALFPDANLLRYWWQATAYPELASARALALSRSRRRSDRVALAAIAAEDHAGESARTDEDLRLAELRLAAWGTLELGVSERRLLDDEILPHWEVPSLGGVPHDLSPATTARTGIVMEAELASLQREVENNPARAATELRQALDAGTATPFAVGALAELLEIGLGVPRDLTEAARILRRAAEAGDGEAAFQYALRLEHGVGVDADHVAALGWYAAAAAQGHGRAAYRLGQTYDEAIGVPRHAASAAHWYATAASVGHPAAHYALARVLLGDDELRATSTAVARDALDRLIDTYPTSSPESDLAWLAGEAWLLARANGLLVAGAALPDRLVKNR